MQKIPSSISDGVWISLIAIVLAALCPWLKSLKKGQHVITMVYSPLYCKQESLPTCLYISRGPQQEVTACSTSLLQPYKGRLRKLCGTVLHGGILRAPSKNQSLLLCKHRFKHTISWGTEKTCCIYIKGFETSAASSILHGPQLPQPVVTGPGTAAISSSVSQQGYSLIPSAHLLHSTSPSNFSLRLLSVRTNTC